MNAVIHRDTATLQAGLDEVRDSPSDGGRLELIVARPGLGEREVLEVGELTLEQGLVGDTWDRRPSKRTPDRSPHRDMQLNIINSRLSALISDGLDQRALAGDQLHIDLDLSAENLPAGTRLAIGDAVIEVTAEPHTGCAKFTKRFGREAMRFVNGDVGRQLRLRGINARVVVAGTIRVGDEVAKVDARVTADATSHAG